MKLYCGQLLALCAFHPNVWGTTAFSPVQGPKALATRQVTNADQSSPVVLHADQTLANLFQGPGTVRVQGETLRTWPLDDATERVQCSIKGTGRPLRANLELWHTPSYVPTKLSFYTEDGRVRPINCVVETPYGGNTAAVFNKGTTDFPFDASVADTGLTAPKETIPAASVGQICQGNGQVISFPFDASVDSVQVLLKTDARNLKARIELTNGPNNVKQMIEFYSSDGYKKPFYAVIETPGSGNVVRIINENSLEFPFMAYVEPYTVGSASDLDPVVK